MAESTRGGRAVVVDNTGRLRGIITRTDLLRQVRHCMIGVPRNTYISTIQTVSLLYQLGYTLYGM